MRTFGRTLIFPVMTCGARPFRRAVLGTGVAVAVALGSVACSGSTPTPPPSAHAAPPVTAAPGATGGLGAALSAAGGGAAGLAALGQLGRNQGVGDDVKSLGGQLTDQGQALTQQLLQAATAAGVTLDTSTPAALQATLTDLRARTGAQFDPAFLQAAAQQLQQVQDQAQAVLTSPDATPEAKAAARDMLAKLGVLADGVAAAGSSAGAGTPSQVAAGNGGQFARAQEQSAVVGGALVALGVVLLGGAAVLRGTRRRRTPR
jgi:predicted outer membrane protein